MLSETARATAAHESKFRVQAPNSLPRAVKIIALDPAAARALDVVARQPWNGAAFFSSLSFAPGGAPGDGEGTTMRAWLGDLAGRAMELVGEVAASDFIIVVTTAGADAGAVSVIAEACAPLHKSLLGLVLPGEGADGAATAKSLAYLRPYASMLVVAGDADYIAAMLTALRA